MKPTIKKILFVLTRVLAVLCAILFVVTLAPALILFNAESRLFKSETYKQALRTTGLYERIPALLAGEIVSAMAVEPAETPAFLKRLTAQDWEVLILTVLPPEEIGRFSEESLDQAFDYLNGKSGSPAISLAAIKQRLRQKSLDAAEQILDAQPPCTLAQLANMGLGMAFGQPAQEIEICKPPGETVALVLPLIGAGVQTLVDTLPDEVRLSNPSTSPELLSRLGWLRLGMQLSLLVPAAFLLFTTLLVVRSYMGWLRWWRYPLAVAGALGLLAGLLTEPAIRLLAATQLSGLPAGLARAVEAALDVLVAVGWTVAGPVLLQSGLLLAGGLAMIVFIRYGGKEQVATVEATGP